MILVDTNVLLDVLQDDPKWADWSQGQLEAASLTNRPAINAVIYAELSMAFARIEELEVVIADASLMFEPIPREAWFLAGKVVLEYRRRKGTKQGVLPQNIWETLTTPSVCLRCLNTESKSLRVAR